jgi:hypothetical protein
MKVLHLVGLFESYDDARTCERQTLDEVEINYTKDVETAKKNAKISVCTLRILFNTAGSFL